MDKIYSVVFSVLEPRIITTLHEGSSEEDVKAKLLQHLKESGAAGYRIHEIEVFETIDDEGNVEELNVENVQDHPVQRNIVDFLAKQKERNDIGQ